MEHTEGIKRSYHNKSEGKFSILQAYYHAIHKPSFSHLPPPNKLQLVKLKLVFILNGCQMWHLTVRGKQMFKNELYEIYILMQSNRETEKSTSRNVHGLI